MIVAVFIAGALALSAWAVWVSLWRDAERSAVDQNAASTLCRWPASKTPLRGRKFASTRVMP